MNNLITQKTFETLQKALNAKAKAEPNYRFYSLWDKICRKDFLQEAYRRSHANHGAAGVDGVTFEQIEEEGREKWLGELQKELKEGLYQPSPLLRVWIPKSNGGERPLGIATIKDRVAQLATMMVLEPIFEADLNKDQYGFRPDLNAKMAIKEVSKTIHWDNRTDVIDGDLKDYFNSIPHGLLMKCIVRRVADGKVLSMIKLWLTVPVVERKGNIQTRTTEAKDANKGIPQGSPLSPLLSNVYFRRFIIAWEKLGFSKKFKARVINYADDFVICASPGMGEAALMVTREIMIKLGLVVHEEKTRLVKARSESFNFLSYTFGTFYGFAGKKYYWCKPTNKAIKNVKNKIHNEAAHNRTHYSEQRMVKELNAIVRGWANYFNEGSPCKPFQEVQKYLFQRMVQWLMKKHKVRGRGSGYKKFSENYLYEQLGLIRLPLTIKELLNAKAKIIQKKA